MIWVYFKLSAFVLPKNKKFFPTKFHKKNIKICKFAIFFCFLFTESTPAKNHFLANFAVRNSINHRRLSAMPSNTHPSNGNWKTKTINRQLTNNFLFFRNTSKKAINRQASLQPPVSENIEHHLDIVDTVVEENHHTEESPPLISPDHEPLPTIITIPSSMIPDYKSAISDLTINSFSNYMKLPEQQLLATSMINDNSYHFSD